MVLPLIKIQGFVLCCVVFHAAAEVSDAGNAVVGYNWSLGWSLSASGLTVWPGEGAWGGWATAGRPCDRDMGLGTIPSTAAGMPVEATLTTPGGYLLGGETRADIKTRS